MEFADFGHDNDGIFGPRTLSDISIASSASSKAQHSSTGSGHMPLDPSFGAAKNVHARRVKFMCSFSGKILPRPSDKKLRYVGGETRIISVPRCIHYAAFVHKMIEIYGPDFALKYQLPQEDLDALVSVSTDEDLENMMEECDRLEAIDGASRLRVFIFGPSDHDVSDLSNMADLKVAEQRYVEAVNTITEGIARKHDDLVLAGSFRNSDELDNYSWNVSHSEVSTMDTFMLTSSCTDPRALLCALDPPTLPSHSAVTNQSRVHLESVSNDDANTNNSCDAAVTTPDLLDLECAGSASSSTSSQHDIHNRCANNIWSPSSQIQVAQESAWHNTNGQNSIYRAEPQFVMEIGKQAADSSRMPLLPAIATSLHRPTMGMEELPLELQTEMPLSPGTALQKQLLVDQEFISENFVGAVQQATLHDGLRQQQTFQQQLSLEEHHCWPRQAVYSPLTGLALEATAVENLSHAKVSAPYKVVLPNLQEIAACGTLASSPPSSPSKIPLIDLTELGYAASYAQDGGITSKVTRTPLQPVSQGASNSVFSNTSTMFSPSNGKVEVPAISQEFQIATTAFLEQVVLPNGDLGARMELSWLATEQSLYQKLDLETSPVSKGMQPVGSLLEESIPSHNAFTFASIQGKYQQPDTNANQTVTTPPPLLGDFSTVAMISDLLQAAQLDDQFSHQAPKVGNLKKPLVDSLFDQHQGLNEHSVARGNDLPLAAINPSKAFCRDSVNDHSDIFYDPILGNESKNVRKLENVQGMPKELGDIDISRNGNDMPATVSQVVCIKTSCEAPPVTTLGTPLSETEHDQLGVDRSSLREEEDMDLCLTVETAEVYQNFELVTEEVETSEQVEDRSINAAATAETEAIALGLQTIRNFDLEELRELGSGTFGTVYHGKWRGSDVAIKRIKSSVFTGRPPERDRLIADFWREACLLGQLHHPNVVAFYGVVPDGPGGTLATVTEYMVNGSLKQVLLKNERALDRRKRLLIAMDAAFGMEYLHGKNVVHFDMKCENLLVNLRDTQRPICKVGDLGLSKVKQQTMVSGGVRGTLPWMAPELLNGSSSLVSEKVDVFSFGIVLWELLTGEEPYADMHYGAIIGGIVSNTLRPTIPRWCDPAWRSLMERCWSATPSERPTFSEIAGSLRAMEASLRQAPPAAGPI